MQYNSAVQTKLRIRYHADLPSVTAVSRYCGAPRDVQGTLDAARLLVFPYSLHDRSVFHVLLFLLCCCLAIPDWT